MASARCCRCTQIVTLRGLPGSGKLGLAVVGVSLVADNRRGGGVGLQREFASAGARLL
ncbi:hypothetical protein D9X30_1234 [Cupriavidus sp. U2]|nr:hypothetical protein D9X30_1234 [Cupriavidus sp. U2]